MKLEILLLGSMTFLFSTVAHATDMATISLFNGKDLSGWRGNDAVWSVEDGAIVGRNTEENPVKHNTFLIYEKPFENFELTLQYKIAGGNSGIQYRSKVIDEQKFIVGGYQADMEAGKKYSGILYEERGRGVLAMRGHKVAIGADGKKHAERFADTDKLQEQIKSEDWNEYRIVANGTRLQHYINGSLTADVSDEQKGKRADRGVIAFQVHRGPPMKVYFKDIIIKLLAADAAPDAGEVNAVQPDKSLISDAVDIHLPEGFQAELVYTVPKQSHGTWISLTRDEKGRLYASDQTDKGLYRITPAKLGDPNAVTTVEKVNVPISAAQGMCWAFDSLYVNVYAKGLFRITDTNGDDHLDHAESIVPLGRGGEHGGHGVIPTEDGKGLYFMAGDHTRHPKYARSRVPANWGEDLLLPRIWDPSGHARGKFAPGGWIARCAPEGENIEMVSVGFRNPYDIALNKHGEMFTFDADMEFDMGLPWYRPTRICQVTSGGEFGWRAGTGKWPSYSLPPVLNVGPGSPTGVVFGTGAKFPAKYQDALFVLDWTFGTIYAVHLKPAGSSYTATKEHFAWRKPLPVTDAVVGTDGALYFTVGGRGTQSSLYRVFYTGSESTKPSSSRDHVATARKQRRLLESYHGIEDPKAIANAWPHLSSQDRFIRYAARIAIESQPVEGWRQRALEESDPAKAGVAMIALARQGNAADLPGVIGTLNGLKLAEMPESQQLAALRAYALAFVRLGKPDESMRASVIAKLDPMMPATSDAVTTELARLLTFLQSSKVVSKTLALIRNSEPTQLPPWAELVKRNDRYGGPIKAMLEDMPPMNRLNYALILRNANAGWTLPQRREYFQFLIEASKHAGGKSYGRFLTNIRDDAQNTLTIKETQALASILDRSLIATPPKGIKPPKGPGRTWTKANAIAAIGQELKRRNFRAGHNLFHAAKCSACHRHNGQGGAVGPDLTTVANKFSTADLLEAIIEPSKVISDQYRSRTVTTNGGRIVTGLVIEGDDQVSVFLQDSTAKPLEFSRSEIESIEDSTVSQMPSGLLDTLNEEELKDLVAYLMSGGNPKADVYQR